MSSSTAATAATESHLLPSIAMFTASLASPPFEKKSLAILPKPFEPSSEQVWLYKGDSDRRRASDSSSSEKRSLSSEQVLAEKRRRNAGASARFRDRRKQRERELQDRCQELEKKNLILENALREADPNHPLVEHHDSLPSPKHSTTDNQAILGRINQLEEFISRFRVEKQSDSKKLDKLDKENQFLKSLLTSFTNKNQDSDE
ncbi:unnamed protein product [Rhizopus stolonifer]